MTTIPNTWLLKLLMIFSVPVMARRTIYFAENEVTYTVLEGKSVSLICEPVDTSSVDISTVHEYLVELGSLIEGLSAEYNFNCNRTTCALTIGKVERRHENKYSCFDPEKSLVMKVIFSPSDSSPVCNCSYETGTYLLGSSQVPFFFSCSSEEGNPPINITLSLDYGDGRAKDITMDPNVTVVRQRQSIAILYTPLLDASFDNVVVFCYVNQQLPDPYPNFMSFCSSVNLTLPEFSVAIISSHVYVKQNVATNITLTCGSDIRDVALEWSDTKYKTNRMNETAIELIITDYVSRGKEPLFIQCYGSYGGKVSSASITIGVDGPLEDQHRHIGAVVIVLVILMIFLILGIIFIISKKDQIKQFVYNR